MAANPLKASLALHVVRVGGVVATVLAVVAAIECQSDVAIAQAACNTSPSRPSGIAATRASDGKVLVAWEMPTGSCDATRFYLQAWRGPGEVVEHTVSSGSTRWVLLPLSAASADPWRIYVRAFNPSGLGGGLGAWLSEVAPEPVPNPCPAGPVPPPTLISANASGRTVYVQWEPDARCNLAITEFVIAGSYTPDGPIVGTVTVPHPNARSWSGEVPPGSYYVTVSTRYYTSVSAASASMLVHVP